MDDSVTLGKAREWLRDQVRQKRASPERCPCCNRQVKIYERTINSGQAAALIWSYRWFKYHPGEWLHIGQYLNETEDYTSGEHAKLTYWGLLERSSELRPDGSKRNGYYRLTKKGEDFILDRIRLTSHIVLYNDKLLRLISKKPDISIIDALGKDFNYRELMQYRD